MYNVRISAIDVNLVKDDNPSKVGHVAKSRNQCNKILRLYLDEIDV